MSCFSVSKLVSKTFYKCSEKIFLKRSATACHFLISHLFLGTFGLSHIHFPEFKVVIDLFEKPVSAFWIPEERRQGSKLELEESFVTEEGVKLTEKICVAVELQETGISEDVILDSKPFRCPRFHGAVPTC